MIPTLEWTDEGVRFLDQTRLPLEESYVLATSYQDVADAITTMVVRGAPAIGVAAAMGMALAEQQINIHAIFQKPGYEDDKLPFVVTVEPCAWSALQRALERIGRMDWLVEKPFDMAIAGSE